jgi:hypothetical protein
MNDNVKLKWPDGEFSHKDFAQINGKSNQQVWSVWSNSRKTGELISAGERRTKGKGKPTLLFKVNPNYVAPVEPVVPVAVPQTPTPVIPTPVVPTPVVKTPTAPVVETSVEVKVEVKPEPVVEPVIEPVVIPVVEITPTKPTTPPVVKISSPVVEAKVMEISEIDETCPVCNHKLLSTKEANGFRVWCQQTDLSICSSTENPFGFGRTIKDAVEICYAKWKRVMVGNNR